LETLVFGFELAPTVRLTELPPDVLRSVDAYRQRERLFKTTITCETGVDFPAESVCLKRVALQRTLFSLVNRSDSLLLAGTYARQATINYEWEGFAEAPLGEASAAEKYLRAHPRTPLASYLHLFIGHRKLCALSGLDGLDPASLEGLTIRREANRELRLARESGGPLIRSVSDYLRDTRKCFER